MSEFHVAKKQFIAGAVCPDCQVVDRLVVETALKGEGAEEYYRRRCVACGFSDPFSDIQLRQSNAIPKGRVERPASSLRTEQIASQTIKIMMPIPPKTDS